LWFSIFLMACVVLWGYPGDKSEGENYKNHSTASEIGRWRKARPNGLAGMNQKLWKFPLLKRGMSGQLDSQQRAVVSKVSAVLRFCFSSRAESHEFKDLILFLQHTKYPLVTCRHNC
jgi:hypothetical protein